MVVGGRTKFRIWHACGAVVCDSSSTTVRRWWEQDPAMVVSRQKKTSSARTHKPTVLSWRDTRWCVRCKTLCFVWSSITEKTGKSGKRPRTPVASARPTQLASSWTVLVSNDLRFISVTYTTHNTRELYSHHMSGVFLRRNKSSGESFQKNKIWGAGNLVVRLV